MIFDTSIVIDMLNGKTPYKSGSISVITLLETIRGLKDSERRLRLMEFLKRAFSIYWLDEEIILASSDLYNRIKSKGKRLGDSDVIIAATALSKNEPLTTQDRDFEQVKDIIDVQIN
ncbi:MAG: type II toxin-antitoxin system VapC family toxin [Candidatus Micrarchaeota archaeon]|nr:type II toxin-antitoxin system VapC family toxin [Candidatus Micrarchaeota archaeon]